MELRDERWWWLDREYGIAQVEARRTPPVDADRPTADELRREAAFDKWIAEGRPENEEEG
jgi:hypothetical protein